MCSDITQTTCYKNNRWEQKTKVIIHMELHADQVVKLVIHNLTISNGIYLRNNKRINAESR